jgi:hypothetical protein
VAGIPPFKSRKLRKIYGGDKRKEIKEERLVSTVSACWWMKIKREMIAQLR